MNSQLRFQHTLAWPLPLALLGLAASLATSEASGIYQDGASARSKSLGGIATAGARGPLDALSANPAALSEVRRPTLDLGLDAGRVDGEFSNRSNDSAGLSDAGVKPHGALAYPLGPVTLALGFIPDAALRSSWTYRDAPGGLDGATSYGTRTHRSEIQVLRFAFGASYAITPTLSAGAGLGLLYNRNQLEAPYIIQTQPQLRGAKVLLDLDTEGWGANGQFGLVWKPASTLQIGLSYTLQSRIRADGRATVDAGRQLANLGLTGVDATADFDAEVTNTFPQIASAGLAWQPTGRLTLLGQVDWINWAAAFSTLDVRLSDVDNDLYRALLAGKGDLDDDVPLRWRDQWVFRAGAEYALDERWAVRAGYRYARNPVPDETLTPLTAVIGEHLVSTGVGFHTGRFTADLAWQWQLPASGHTDRSDLLTGEYSQSDIQLSVHFLSLTARWEF